MSEKRFRKVMGFIKDNTCEKGDVEGVMDLTEIEVMLNELYEENEQLRTQLAICQQSKSDDGLIKVWQVPPIPKGMRITTSTTSDGEIDE